MAMKHWMISGALLLCLTGCGGNSQTKSTDPDASPSPKEPETLTVSGSLVAPLDVGAISGQGGDAIAGLTPCTTSRNYHDIAKGTRVTVTDAEGTTVGQGALGEGKLDGKEGEMLLLGKCRFPFEVEDVPAGSGFYSIEVGNRGSETFPVGEIESGDVSLSLG